MLIKSWEENRVKETKCFLIKYINVITLTNKVINYVKLFREGDSEKYYLFLLRGRDIQIISYVNNTKRKFVNIIDRSLGNKYEIICKKSCQNLMNLS